MAEKDHQQQQEIKHLQSELDRNDHQLEQQQQHFTQLKSEMALKDEQQQQ